VTASRLGVSGGNAVVAGEVSVGIAELREAAEATLPALFG
jgi:hypothetical protein